VYTPELLRLANVTKDPALLKTNTVPPGSAAPVAAFVTVPVMLPPVVAKVAETLRAVVIETEQVGTVPLQAPPQPLKLHPLLGVAVSVTVGPPV
jgi:hypothetical protein